ncbi:MAG TPA: DUF3108 domain-containing protein [Gemmatimonadales bacterium]|nr:DUF3108 domain-containing protein [Gemmatimonadales bacterium]
MIYVCVPVHDEARTVGLVLWKVRQVFTAFPREYQLLVCDDASTDDTARVLATYAKVLPMTVVTHRERQGYARSLEELLRLALQRTDRPKRDCAITLHADLSHPADTMPEMVRRLESGADVVAAELLDERRGAAAPLALRWARRWAPRLLAVPGVRDSVSGMLAVRLIAWRQAQRRDAGALLTTDGWSANAELLAHLSLHARRVEVVAATARYDLLQRPPRTTPWQQLLRAWRARGVVRAALTTAALLLFCAVSPQARAASGPAVPFPVGERLTFGAKFGAFSVGEATMEVAGIDTLRGAEMVRLRFHIEGGALWYHLDQTLESWVGRADFRSRRYRNQTDERGKRWERQFDIYPESGFYREAGRDSTFPTVRDPLDDAAFLYWIRTVPFQVGKTYEYRRYFRPERNPVIVEVLGREKVKVAGRKWSAIVISPSIPNGGGIFAEKADARIWISDDSSRVILALQSKFSFGMMTLKLKEFVVPGLK